MFLWIVGGVRNLDAKVNRQTKWLWAASAVALLSLTGCGLYPSHPGKWPPGVWGDILKFVSDTLDFFARYVGNSYGISLLIVTVLVRFLILPLMIKQIRTTKLMQEMQPQLMKIRSQYKGDSRKIQEETMKLYQSAGVNPMSGCLPMVIQLPILYALYGAIYGNVHLNQSTFLGIFHLGQPDKYWILPVLAAITTFLSTKVMMTGQDQQQKMMLYIMPLFILFIGARFPSGLALYWIYGNIFTTVQTYFIRVRPAKAAAAMDNQKEEKVKKQKEEEKDKKRRSK